MAIARNVVLLGVGVAGISFLSKSNRGKVKDLWADVKTGKALSFWNKRQTNVDHLIEKAGHPDPYDHEDNKMVDEGAMYSVNYFNNMKHS